MRSKMNTVFYRCPATGLTVDEWVGDIPHNDKATAFYEAITCRACNRIHLITFRRAKCSPPAAKRLHDECDDANATAKIHLLDHSVGVARPSISCLRRVLPLALRDVEILTYALALSLLRKSLRR